MKKKILVLSLMSISILSFASNQKVKSVEVSEETPVKNNWGVNLASSNFHLGLDIQTKYMWRGMEMMPKESSPVLFPSVNYQYNGLFLYAMGGYSLNGKYAEVDLGASYTYKGIILGVYDYYYPTIDQKDDEYLGGGKHTGHWLEACLTYAPETLPVWFTVSNFFYGADKYLKSSKEEKQAYSTYFEIGTFYDFHNGNRISLALGATPAKSCYNGYSKNFSICNIDLKYTYNIKLKNGWILPLSVEYIHNPVFDKSYVNLTSNFAF